MPSTLSNIEKIIEDMVRQSLIFLADPDVVERLCWKISSKK
jgi:hypothetical protein